MTRGMQTPEGALIQKAAKARGLSAAKAAAKAGISSVWWRHVVNGYQPLTGSRYIEIVGNADTIAKMAAVAGVTPDELRKVGRKDAADALEALTPEPLTMDEAGSSADRLIEQLDPDLALKTNDQLLEELRLRGLLLAARIHALDEGAGWLTIRRDPDEGDVLDVVPPER